MIKKIVSVFLVFVISINYCFGQKSKNNNFEISKNLDIYYALFKEVNEYYVDTIEPGKMVKKSIDEMLNDLDPYTNFIAEEDMDDFRFQTTGKYGGIGCAMRDLGDYIAIDELYENGPALKAGLHPGDLILEIDNKSAKGLEDDDIRVLIKGSPGTIVKLKVKNPISKIESEINIKREEILVNNVVYSGLIGASKDIAYVRLSQFTERAAQNIKNALDSCKQQNSNMKGIIIDLRFNPGGLLDEAIAICNLFVPKEQLVVSTKGKVEEWDKKYFAPNTPWDINMPITVLINKGSASASEIVSGTLQDLDRAVVIGQKSYGKGLVQSTKSLPYNTKVKITTAKYYTPSGRCIQAVDYSHRNDDGSVGEVPDSLKKQFATKNGRKVFDGGGIEPDVKTKFKESNKVISTLYNKNLTFNYATEYVSKHPTIESCTTFNLSDADVNSFINWLDKQDYSYKTKTEEALERMKEIATKEKYFDAVKNEYESLAKALSSDKKQDLIKYKADIKRMLQAEIIGRYYFLKGRIINDMKEDVDINEALLILSDTTKYNQLLNK